MIFSLKKSNGFYHCFCFCSLLFFLLIFLPILFSHVEAHDIRGRVSIQARLFPNDPIHSGQEHNAYSLVAAPEYFHQFDDGSLFTFLPFVRVDATDSERTHFDIRELYFMWRQETFELGVGVSREFWGVVESTQLVNIINQTDLVENPFEHEKLGQPMVNLSYSHEWGTFDFFVLPYFRERTFPGKKGRLRLGLVVDTDQPLYESADEENHIDFALRYFHTIQKLDIGVSHFIGTSRDPLARIGIKDGEFVIRPFYEQISQTGVDLLLVTGKWIWKFEGIYRDASVSTNYYAMVGGFEYIFDGIGGTGMDLGVFLEYLHDDRGDELSVTEDDFFVGLRWAFNDVRGTSILVGVTQDVDTDVRFPVLKASTRLDSHWRLSMEYRGLMNQTREDIFFDLRDDDFFQMELAYHF